MIFAALVRRVNSCPIRPSCRCISTVRPSPEDLEDSKPATLLFQVKKEQKKNKKTDFTNSFFFCQKQISPQILESRPASKSHRVPAPSDSTAQRRRTEHFGVPISRVFTRVTPSVTTSSTPKSENVLKSSSPISTLKEWSRKLNYFLIYSNQNILGKKSNSRWCPAGRHLFDGLFRTLGGSSPAQSII